MAEPRRLLLSLVAAALFAGCGDSKPGTGTPGGSSSGGAGAATGGVEGTWALDLGKIIDAAVAEQAKKMETATEQEKAMMKMMGGEKMIEMMKGMLKDAKMEITLKADKTALLVMSGIPGDEAKTGEGSWSQDGEFVTVTPKTINGKPAEGGDAKALKLKRVGATLVAAEEGGPPLILVRK